LLRHWATDEPEREAFLASTAWASVRWLKSLGKPLGPSLWSGFIIHHQVLSDFNVLHNGEPATQHGTLDLPTPSDWDVPEDETHYRFRFFARVPPMTIDSFNTKNTNRLWLTFSKEFWSVPLPPSRDGRFIR